MEHLLGFLKARHTAQMQVTGGNQHILYSPVPPAKGRRSGESVPRGYVIPLVQLVSLGNISSAYEEKGVQCWDTVNMATHQCALPLAGSSSPVVLCGGGPG